MKRSRTRLEDVATWDNLMAAFGLAAQGKRGRGDVEHFRDDLDGNISALGHQLLSGRYRPGPMRQFSIRDPKPRMIHAPAFRDRVVHHALMLQIGPRLDRSLIHNSFACRVGKGSHAAIRRAARFSGRAKWYVHADVAQYFANIDHDILKAQIARKFSDHGVLDLVGTIIDAHGAGRGLPIGALTSQVFANVYLAPVDRRVSEDPKAVGYVRYMDDMVWWTQSKVACSDILKRVEDTLQDLRLTLKASPSACPTAAGMTFCGSRVLPDRVYLSRRARARTKTHLQQALAEFASGRLDVIGLQRRSDAALAAIAHCEAKSWRRNWGMDTVAGELADA